MDESVGSVAPRSLSAAVLVAAAFVGVVGLGAAALGSNQLSFAAYLGVLVLGTGVIAAYRWLEVRRSLRADYVISPRWQRRLALVPVVLILGACAANAYVWATELAKI